MSKPARTIVGYVLSHSGKKEGPWEAAYGAKGTPTKSKWHRMTWMVGARSVRATRAVAWDFLGNTKELHPDAKLVRLTAATVEVIAELTAAEKAVVKAAMDFRASILSCRKHLGPYRAPFDEACGNLERKRNLT